MTSPIPEMIDPIARLMATFKVHTWEPVRALTPICTYPTQAHEITAQSMEVWLASKQFEQAHSYLRNYPSNSLLFGYGREILYHLVRTLRPEHVVEVGTYFTGTAEVIARALWENGFGTLHTADPFGSLYCPVLLDRLPRELLKHIAFSPVYSMEFFFKLGLDNVKSELIFIDGNHDYEYASFDLISAAKMVKPGGIVVLDNIELPGPYWAARDFLAANPRWEEIGDSISSFSPSNPFDGSKTYAGNTYFALLKAPTGITIHQRPYGTGQIEYHSHQLSGIKLIMDEPAPKGHLHVRLWLNTLGGGAAESLQKIVVAELDGQTMYTVTLDAPLRTTFLPTEIDYQQKMEMALFWEPIGHNEPLRLAQRPEPFA
jgi:hypothetical protein